jgi:hypothetical protein
VDRPILSEIRAGRMCSFSPPSPIIPVDVPGSFHRPIIDAPLAAHRRDAPFGQL